MVTGKSLGDKGERLGPVAVFYDLGEFLPLPGHRHCLQTVDKPRTGAGGQSLNKTQCGQTNQFDNLAVA